MCIMLTYGVSRILKKTEGPRSSTLWYSTIDNFGREVLSPTLNSFLSYRQPQRNPSLTGAPRQTETADPTIGVNG